MNIFEIKKTKMLDEATFGHKPQSIFLVVLIFMLVFLIGNTIQGVILAIPTAVYAVSAIFSNEAFQAFIEGVKNDTVTEEGYEEVIEQVTTEILASMPAWLTVVNLFATAATIAAAIFYCKKFEKRPISSMGIRKEGAFFEYLIGVGIGTLMMGLTYLIAYLTGSVDISVSEYISPIIILFFLGFVVQGASEEILVRGYLMISLARDTKVFVAILLSSLFFGLMHLGNPNFGVIGFINIILFGVFLGIYVFKRGSLWGACAIHTMWNFIQGNVFGVSVSGLGIMPSFFTTTVNEGKDLISGGAFGLEGGIASTCVLLLGILIVLLVKTKESEASEFEPQVNIF
ncbi:MAG: CPBP family intramembrane metalloprotease [Clostridia bacterium]|nr:CPBP family intramembrane metalloprotease [Clostridia bacterium]MBQ7907872.1 CPBP family intramembrane metalloprotease [Clostridia bacterium]